MNEEKQCENYLMKKAHEMGHVLNPNKEQLNKAIRSMTKRKLGHESYPCPCKVIPKDGVIDPAELCCPCDEGKEDLKNGKSCHCGIFLQEGW